MAGQAGDLYDYSLVHPRPVSAPVNDHTLTGPELSLLATAVAHSLCPSICSQSDVNSLPQRPAFTLDRLDPCDSLPILADAFRIIDLSRGHKNYYVKQSLVDL